MQHLVIKAVAAAVLVGAGTGAMTDIGRDKPDIPRDVLNPMVGGQAMLARASILENTSKSPEHSTLAAAIRVAGFESLLKTKGPYTIFAPTDAAYAALPQKERGALVHPENRTAAAKDVGYLIVPGRLDSQVLLKLINENEGQAKLKTIEGGTLTAMLNGPTNIVLVDERGNIADISTYDVYQSNGVMQVIDKVIRPS
jgi:uncharacterized surface protein with fasciclin (FAS1) repeats